MNYSLTSSIKKLSIALGVVGVGTLIGLPALAQSSSSGASPEFKLSKEGFIILCDRTPLNSRCEGSPYYTGSTSQSPDENPAFSPSGTTAPTQNLPSETDETEPSSGAETLSPDGTTNDGSSPDSTIDNGSSPDSNSTSPDGSTTSPSGTTAPTQDLPSESDETAPGGQSYDGTMQDGASGSGSPDNTTAPTQNLPSETDGK